MKNAPRLAAAALALLVAACGAPAPKEQYFTLSSPAAGTPPAAASPSVFVGPVAVPEGFDRSQMVLATGPNRVDVSDDYRWAEPLRSGIARVVAETLTRELGSSRVMASRQASALAFDDRVTIEIQRFDSSLDTGATLDALWTATQSGGALKSGRTFVREPAASHDPGGVVAAHSRALERLGRDIAAAIRSLEESRPK
jgi:uncharacterized lipoprotein YmbA